MAVSPIGQIGDRVRMNASKADQENATAHLHWVVEKIAKEVKFRTATAQIPAPKVRKDYFDRSCRNKICNRGPQTFCILF